MSIGAMAQIVATRAVLGPPTGTATSGSEPTARRLLETIGAYIPTDITTAYVAAAGGMAATQPPLADQNSFRVALGVAILASFSTWVIGHRRAEKKAQAANPPEPPPKAFASFKAGYYEIIVAGIAFFVWATATPGSWYDFGKDQVWAPALLVVVASIVIGGLATLLNRAQST
jgi:hypothetical protein